MLENESKLGDVLSIVPPGVSWTAPPKGRPWLSSPKMTDVNSVAQGYLSALGQASIANDILDALETKTPLVSIAESFMLSGVAKGQHTLDAGILVMPVIIEALQAIADFNNIKTVKFNEDLERGTTIHPRILRKFVKEASAPIEEPATTKPVVEPAGLMARKSKGIM